MVSHVRYIKYYNSTFYYIFFFWFFLFFHRGSFLTSFVLGLWAGNAKLFNVNKFYYCYSCVSFVFAHPLPPIHPSPSLPLAASRYSYGDCGIFGALRLHIQHFIVFHFKFNAPSISARIYVFHCPPLCLPPWSTGLPGRVSPHSALP